MKWIIHPTNDGGTWHPYAKNKWSALVPHLTYKVKTDYKPIHKYKLQRFYRFMEEFGSQRRELKILKYDTRFFFYIRETAKLSFNPRSFSSLIKDYEDWTKERSKMAELWEDALTCTAKAFRNSWPRSVSLSCLYKQQQQPIKNPDLTWYEGLPSISPASQCQEPWAQT